MQNSILIKYLKRLDSKELKEFKSFIQSPFYNRREDVKRLFEYLETNLSTHSDFALKKENVLKRVFPNQGNNEKALGYTMSYLLKLLKKYLTISEIEKEAHLNQLFLCKAIRKKNLDGQFEKEMTFALKSHQKQTFRNTQYHYQKYLLLQEEAAFQLGNGKSRAFNFKSIGDELATFFIADILRQGCNLLAHQAVSKENYQLNLLPEIIDFLKNSNNNSSPAVDIYYHAFQSLSLPDEQSEKHFHQLKALIFEHWEKFPAEEGRDIYLLAINYCIKHLNSGKREFIQEAFDFYQSGLSNKVLLENGYLSGFTYKNISRLGMALEKQEWVKDFLEQYKTHLPPKERDNLWRYNLAWFYFEKTEYEKAMHLLRQVELTNVYNNLDARRMLLRSYFELEEFNALESLLESFQTYIRRQKNIGYHQESYLNFTRFVKQILSSATMPKSKLENLKKKIQETKRVAERNWLLGKL